MRRSEEIISLRMKVRIKEEITEYCKKKKISRNNFIFNCIVKELRRKNQLTWYNL